MPSPKPTFDKIERVCEIGKYEPNRVWLMSFGYGQEFPNRYLKLKGTLQGTADAMFDMFGDRWSNQYHADKEGELIECAMSEITLDEIERIRGGADETKTAKKGMENNQG